MSGLCNFECESVVMWFQDFFMLVDRLVVWGSTAIQCNIDCYQLASFLLALAGTINQKLVAHLVVNSSSKSSSFLAKDLSPAFQAVSHALLVPLTKQHADYSDSRLWQRNSGWSLGKRHAGSGSGSALEDMTYAVSSWLQVDVNQRVILIQLLEVDNSCVGIYSLAGAYNWLWEIKCQVLYILAGGSSNMDVLSYTHIKGNTIMCCVEKNRIFRLSKNAKAECSNNTEVCLRCSEDYPHHIEF
ncbi:hypothetical protein VNO77_15112 [Canavalia gladiata]|uniref:Uncharacterized protein n=1 Tax=Canavalia gladiata TaxID=3824 RepID=A0AAN9QVQ0_CANGL